jgi:serine/threonine-protein kinase
VHAAGIIHGDVKPANIVIEEDTGRPVLVDFGLAGQGADVNEFGGGTPSYASPEQAGLGPHGATVSTRSDVYALGCTVFEMLTGHLPFEVKDPLEMLRCHAKLASLTRTVAVAEGDVRDESDRLVAKALGTFGVRRRTP